MVENEPGEVSEKVELASTKGLTKDLIMDIVLLKMQSIFLQAHYKIN